MEMLGSYELTGHLSSENAGYSLWGFGKKEGRDYFIKQFLSPKYPENDTVSSPERLKKKMKQCQKFEEQKLSIYQALNANTDGNAVRVTEFFRIGTKYYITMPKIVALPWTVDDVVALPEREKRRLCSIIAHGISGIHRGHIIHADLKHDNVLYMRTGAGNVTAKIIDFDSSFLESDTPAPGENIIGDQVYFSPEACMSMMGYEAPLTCKMDIFALGVLFHQYFAGHLPEFDAEQFNCAGESVAAGVALKLSDDLPADVRQLLERMLQQDPAKRPAAEMVFRGFLAGGAPDSAAKPAQAVAGGNFFAPGDL